VGLQSPALGLNASFTQMAAGSGLAFVSQSGALATAVLDWAGQRGIGFRASSRWATASTSISATCSTTWPPMPTPKPSCCASKRQQRAQVHVGGRLAARGKPVIVLKVGRDAAPGADLVFDAAIRRAGMLRVYSTEDLFDAVETLARQRPQRGERLAVLTNGGGLG
jgi:acetyl-CoA synthetase (ADP-forming)/acetyltransferase